MITKNSGFDAFNPIGLSGGSVSGSQSVVVNPSSSAETAQRDDISQALEHAEQREDTAIQRAVADMKAAGINPILGFSGASSASSNASTSNLGARSNLEVAKIAGLINIVSSAIGLAGAFFRKK